MPKEKDFEGEIFFIDSTGLYVPGGGPHTSRQLHCGRGEYSGR